MGINLKEDFFLKGTELVKFYGAVSEMDESTSFRTVKKGELEIWSVLSEDLNRIVFRRIIPGQASERRHVPSEKIRQLPKEIVSCLMKEGYMLSLDHRAVYVSEKFIDTFAPRLGLSGESVKEQTSARDMFLGSLMARQWNEEIMLVSRSAPSSSGWLTDSLSFLIHSGGCTGEEGSMRKNCLSRR